ncbi:hypothetical protein NCS57_01227900 [Fusarium keratoplasticum]|uniref:Uncharacterized protein n=1 Tax=Fusarium keratoplasticum TaxID=1328300 RepID=A0ACC0QJ23_9HYPO|nr:hypothetical protein NCS57_01227900 [Fusarium keratoplasticum]KAI8654808.1 hypothetical protein NCS57_01227900 [Fusarium keratoplasticum]
MSRPNKLKPDEENGTYIARLHQRGLLIPPPTKTCFRCKNNFTGASNICRPCAKILYPNKKPKPDAYLDVCQVCLPQLEPREDKRPARTLHLGPGWCVRCNAVPGNEFPLICDECDIVEPLPVFVNDDRGGKVDMLQDVETLWCVKCEKQAESHCRL